MGRRDVRDIIHSLKARGTTVFLNSHLLSEVEQVCDRVAVIDHGRVVAKGTLADLLGSGGVRLKVTDLDGSVASLARFGNLTREGDWLAIAGTAAEAVPDVVAEVVRLGGRVHAVEPQHQTLEERFMELLGGEDRT